MIETSSASIEAKPETVGSVCNSNASRSVCPKSPNPATAPPTRLSTTAIAKVTAGPAAATSNSVAGVSLSRSIRATPPKIQSWMLEMPIPWRSAEKAWPSSCRTIEPKNPIAVATASAKGAVAVLDSPSASPNVLRQREDQEEEDQEPGPVDRDPDPANVKESEGAASEHPSMVSG